MYMKMKGHLRKMDIKNDSVLQYSLVLNNEKLHLNPYLGAFIRIDFLQEIRCMACQKTTHKSYNQGYCYQCFQTLAINDRCIMAPEKCHYDQGSCREPSWGEKFCMQDHVVYLSWTSGLKVGLTRYTQQINRWMDQGAIHAISFAKVKSRKEAGLLEDHLRKWYRDRTNWKQMLLVDDHPVDMEAEYHKAIEHAKGFEIEAIAPEVAHFKYPVEGVGVIENLSLDKQKVVSGHLLGMKGQYLILDSGVINLRKYGSYLVEVEIS